MPDDPFDDDWFVDLLKAVALVGTVCAIASFVALFAIFTFNH